MVSKGEKHALEALAAIVIIVLMANYFAVITIPGLPQQKFTPTGPNGGGQGTIDTTMRDNYLAGRGVFELDCKGFDTADPATTYDPGTEFDVFWYHFIGGQWIPEGGAYSPWGYYFFDAKAEDNGYAWIAVKAHNTSYAYYVDYQKIKQANSYISSYQYTDVDLDGQREFVFQYSLANHAIPSSGYPVISFNTWLITYDASFTGSYGLVHLSNATGATAIGGPDTTRYFEWYVSMSAEKTGVAIYKVQLDAGNSTTAVTDETKVRLKKLQIPGLGNLDVSQFKKDPLSDRIRWTYTISTSFDGADYIIRMPQSINKFYMTATIEFNLGATTDIPLTLTVYYLIPPTEAGTSTSSGFDALLT